VGITLEPAWLLRVATPVNCGETSRGPLIQTFVYSLAWPHIQWAAMLVVRLRPGAGN
jgi:hypothetical protein